MGLTPGWGTKIPHNAWYGQNMYVILKKFFLFSFQYKHTSTSFLGKIIQSMAMPCLSLSLAPAHPQLHILPLKRVSFYLPDTSCCYTPSRLCPSKSLSAVTVLFSSLLGICTNSQAHLRYVLFQPALTMSMALCEGLQHCSTF